MNVNRRRRKPLLGRAPRLTNIPIRDRVGSIGHMPPEIDVARTTYGGRMGDCAYKIPLC